MKKIKILFYSHTIDFGGTWRSHERILLNINKDIFDPYVMYNPDKDNNRLHKLKEVLNEDKIIPFYASKNKLGAGEGYRYKETDFNDICKKYNFDIIHFARSGYYEWPFIGRISPVQIETNIFGGKDKSKFLDYSVSICNTINNLRNKSDIVIYNPIPDKINNEDDLKSELNIPNDYAVFGRIGRKDNFHGISLDSLSLLKKDHYKFKYIIIGACNKTLNRIKQLNLSEDCIILETTNDDELIHKFYNTIDLFLHYRSDGECHSTAISQSLMYGKPVISHYAGYNGQSETIMGGGYVAKTHVDYYNKIKEIINSKKLYDELSLNAITRSKEFKYDTIIPKWEKTYIDLYNKNIIK